MHLGIVHYAAPPGTGGVELTIYHHARVLLSLGHQVTVVAGQGGSFLPGLDYVEEPLAGSRSPEILAAGQELAAGSVPWNFADLVERARWQLLHHLADCDVIIGHNLFTLHKNLILTAAVHELVRNREGPPWVAWHHDFAWLRPDYHAALHPGKPWTLLREPWPGLCHVTVSEAQREDLALLYRMAPEEIAVVPPGIEPAAFYSFTPAVAALVERWDLLRADLVFLLPARITRRKNIHLALEWLAEVRDESGWDARLIVTGPPGPHNPTNAAYLESLLARRGELGLADAAHFVCEPNAAGTPLPLPDEDIAALYRVADALLFTSRQEGFGIPLLEAALARLPIFATDLAPFRESAGPYATLFDPATPPREVARRIVASLREERAFKLRNRVLRDFTWDQLVRTRLLPLVEAQLAKCTTR